MKGVERRLMQTFFKEMKKLNILKKSLSFLTCSALSLALVAGYNNASSGRKSATEASAKSLNEIQAERDVNNQKIAELENQIADLQGSADDQKAYQETLMEQIELIRENIGLLNTELEAISSDIKATEKNISDLDQKIVDQEKEIDESVELFKERLFNMYVSGNDNLASIVVGSSSFYDIISTIEMANRMAEYDEELINGILDDIENLEKNKSELETEKLTLEMKLESQERRKEEKEASLSDLDEKMKSTQSEIDRIDREKQIAQGKVADLEKINAAYDAEEQAIYDAIQKAAEEKKRQEEEAERKRQEALANQQQQQPATGNGDITTDPGTPDTPVDPDTYVPPQSTGGFMWPAPGFSYISSPFGARWGRNHNGIDIGDAGIHGGAAVASQGGTVIAVSSSCTHDYPKNNGGCGCGGNYGNYVLISHDGTYSTMYAHLSSVNVSVGDYVSQGQVVGYIGCTGFSTGSHLHFEIRVNGYANDPMSYVSR